MGEVIFLFGPPGSGKGTQAARLAKHLNAVHISTGELLRQDAQSDPVFKDGSPGKVDDVLRLLGAAIDGVEPNQLIIFDGVGRLPEEITWLHEKLAKVGRTIRKVIILQVSEDEVRARLNKRAIAEGRDDDELQGIERRIQVYREVTSKNQAFWRDQAPVAEIDGTGTPDEVTERIQEALQHAA